MNYWIPDISNYSGYRYRALSEELKSSTKLFAHREMTWWVRVIIGTVAKAYKLLADWGLVSARRE